MKHLKQLIIFLLATVLILSFASCNATEKNNENIENTRQSYIESLNYDSNLYNLEEIKQIENIIKEYKDKINKADSKNLGFLQNQALEKIASIDTKKTITIKKNACDEINKYLDNSNYYKYELDKINSIKKDAVELIKKGDNNSKFDEFVNKVKAELDKILKKDAVSTEFIANYKTVSIDKINKLVSLDNYYQNEKDAINVIISKYSNQVNDTNYISEIDRIISLAKNEILEIKNKSIIDNTFNEQWASAQGNKYNMPITNTNTPKEGKLLWANKIASGWFSAPSLPIIIDDFMFVAYSNNLIKYDLASGEELARTTMQGSAGYGITPPTFGDGKIFVNIGNGSIQAFDYKTLKSIWIYKGQSGYQTLSPITYDNGHIYTGFKASESQFVCLSTNDIDKENELEEKDVVWKYTHNGGFYSAGALVIGNTVIVGSDKGTNGAKLYQFNKLTGELIKSFDVDSEIRCSISYDINSKHIYFTTKSCKIYSVKVAKDYSLSDLKSATICEGLESTLTPIIYNNRLYVGAGKMGQPGKVAVINATTLENIYYIDLPYYPQGAMLLSTAYLGDDNTIYLYTTYNGNPGGIKVIIDKPGQTEANIKDLFVPQSANQNYCISNIICDNNGNLYFKNDSGNIFAITHNNIENLKKILKDSIDKNYNQDNYTEDNLSNRNSLIDTFNTELENLSTLSEINAKFNELINNLSIITSKNDVEIKSTLANNKEYNSNKITFEVVAKNSDNKVLRADSLIVKLNGYPVEKLYSDRNKTTYPLTFTQYKNTVEITAIQNNKRTTKIYTIYYVEKPISFTISINAFSIGCGYILSPKTIVADNDYLLKLAKFFYNNDDIAKMKSLFNLGYVLKYELTQQGYTIDNNDFGKSFYLNGINNFKHSNKIPEELKNKIKESGFIKITMPDDFNSLSGFDYTPYSGFMYKINNLMPNVGIGENSIKNGDTVSIGFSLAFGADIGDPSYMGKTYFEVVNRDNLAKLISLSENYINTKSYTDALTKISTLGVTQEELNQAFNNLYIEVNHLYD